MPSRSQQKGSKEQAIPACRLKSASLLAVALFWLPLALHADTKSTSNPDTQNAPHHTHKVKKTLPPPLPSGTRGPVPQVPLDALPAVAPQVTFENGLLTIVAPNSTLGDILREVRSHTSAEIDVPANANERVALRLGPAPARDVMAELLNGSHFNYILLGSADNANALVRVVLVAKTGPDTPDAPAQANATPAPNSAKGDTADADAADTVDPIADQAATEADETPSDEPGVKTPQQMLQEMQQRQLQQQQQQQQQNGQTTPAYPPPGGAPMPQRGPGPQPQPQPQDQ
jgi:hypothetical protein